MDCVKNAGRESMKYKSHKIIKVVWKLLIAEHTKQGSQQGSLALMHLPTLQKFNKRVCLMCFLIFFSLVPKDWNLSLVHDLRMSVGNLMKK